jgi:putative Mg2+ transporter-C (MgtC) family protein
MIQLISAAVIGILIGKVSNKSPTARTFALICTGAALITIVSIEYFKVVSFPWLSDPGRLTAQVVSALGFIGTGLIWISEENKAQELSIAASLWVTAILGVFIGAGLYKITAAAIVILLIIFWSCNHIIKYKNKSRSLK